MTVRGLRWYIVALISCGTILNYLARNSLGVLAPTLKTTLHITTQQYSYIVGAFQGAYTLMQPVCGGLVDYIGLRFGFALFAVGWSVSNMLHAVAASWMALAVFRAMLGATEAAAIPAGMKAIASWFPRRERSIATGYFNAGTSFGALLAPPLVGFVSLYLSWRAAFIVTGGLGLIWAAAWVWLYRSPSQHPAITTAERDMIAADRNLRQTEAPASRMRPGVILRSSRFWTLAVPRFLAEPAWQTFSFWIPLYLSTERGFDIKSIALFAWLPFLAADLGGILGGYLSPFFMRVFGLSLVSSRVLGIFLGAICMIAPGSVMFAHGHVAVIALFSIGGFAHQIISVLINTLTADLFPDEQVGLANGLVGQAGWLGGLIFSLAIGQLAETVGYGPLFVCLSLSDLIGAVYLFLMVRHYGIASSAKDS